MRLFAAVAMAVLAGSANAQIYRCDAGNGVVEYSNTPSSGKDRACKAVDLPAVTTIPAPKVPAGRARSAESARNGEVSARATEGFPKVDQSTQRARDSDRKQIIEQELKKEQLKLVEIKKEYNNGEPERLGDERNYQKYLDRLQRLKDELARTEGNVESLKKELGSVK